MRSRRAATSRPSALRSGPRSRGSPRRQPACTTAPTGRRRAAAGIDLRPVREARGRGPTARRRSSGPSPEPRRARAPRSARARAAARTSRRGRSSRPARRSAARSRACRSDRRSAATRSSRRVRPAAIAAAAMRLPSAAARCPSSRREVRRVAERAQLLRQQRERRREIRVERRAPEQQAIGGVADRRVTTVRRATTLVRHRRRSTGRRGRAPAPAPTHRRRAARRPRPRSRTVAIDRPCRLAARAVRAAPRSGARTATGRGRGISTMRSARTLCSVLSPPHG